MAGDYPYQYRTYKQNDANGTEGKHDYLQLYPALNTMNADDEAMAIRTLDSVKSARTQKKEQLANCISCKTPQYTALVNAEADTAYQKFNDMIDQFDTSPSAAITATRTTPPN